MATTVDKRTAPEVVPNDNLGAPRAAKRQRTGNAGVSNDVAVPRRATAERKPATVAAGLAQSNTVMSDVAGAAATQALLASLLEAGDDAEATAGEAPTCTVCFSRVTRKDRHHFLDLASICPSETPCRLCSTCVRNCLEACVGTLNARSAEAEVLQSIGCPGRPAVCLACRRAAVTHPPTPTAAAAASPDIDGIIVDDTAAGVYDMGELEARVLGDPTCACVDCAHARGGPAEAERVAAEEEAEAARAAAVAAKHACATTAGILRSSPVSRFAHGVPLVDNSSNPQRALHVPPSTWQLGAGVRRDARELAPVSIVAPRSLDAVYVDGDVDSPRPAGMPSSSSAVATTSSSSPAPLPASLAIPGVTRHSSITVGPGASAAGGPAPPAPRFARSPSSSSLGGASAASAGSTGSTGSTCGGCGSSTHAGDVVCPSIHVADCGMLRAMTPPKARQFLGDPTWARRLWRRVLDHRTVMQMAYRCPFGVFKRCPVPGCDSREYVVFDERSQFMRFMACNHEVCRNCERQVVQRGMAARRNHNRHCMVTLGSQLVRKPKNWDSWRTEPAYEQAVRAMHQYTSEVVARRQRLECPRCGVIVAKTGSCNHIVCECGEHLCQACHRRLADMLPHPVVKAANAHAVAPYGTYVAVDEVAMVQNHYEVGGWKRQEPQKRLCPRLFSEVADWFPMVLHGRSPAPGQTRPVGLQDDASGSDQTELNRHSQAVRLRILALILNRRVVTKSALRAVAEYDKERNRGQLMAMWPKFPMLSVHELMYVMWEWGRVDRLSNSAVGRRSRNNTAATTGAAETTWIYVPKAMAFHYDPSGTYRDIDVLSLDVFSDAGSEDAVLSIPSLVLPVGGGGGDNVVGGGDGAGGDSGVNVDVDVDVGAGGDNSTTTPQNNATTR